MFIGEKWVDGMETQSRFSSKLNEENALNVFLEDFGNYDSIL